MTTFKAEKPMCSFAIRLGTSECRYPTSLSRNIGTSYSSHHWSNRPALIISLHKHCCTHRKSMEVTSVPTAGISKVSDVDFSFAKTFQSTIKLIGTATTNSDGSLAVFVSPTMASIKRLYSWDGYCTHCCFEFVITILIYSSLPPSLPLSCPLSLPSSRFLNMFLFIPFPFIPLSNSPPPPRLPSFPSLYHQVPLTSPFAAAKGPGNVVVMTSANMGTSTYSGPGQWWKGICPSIRLLLSILIQTDSSPLWHPFPNMLFD